MHVLRALRQQQLLACSAASLPTCLSCLSTSSALLQQSNPQLMRVQQQQSQNGQEHAQQKPIWAYLGAGGAAAAAGWAAWNYSNSTSSTVPSIDPMRIARASPRAQAAVAAACAAPLLHLQHALNPTPAQLQGIAAALESEAVVLGPELATGLWGLAMCGAVLPEQQLARLAGAATEHIQQLPVYEAIIAAWAITLLTNHSSNDSNSGGGSSSSSSSSGGSSSSNSSSSSSRLSSAAWQQLLQRLQAAHPRELKDEASLLYLLHAAMQQAAAGAAVKAQPHIPSSTDSSSSGSGSGREGDVGYRTAALDQPHATVQEVLAVVEPLNDKVKKRLATAYQEYVPFQPYVEGPLLVVLHIAKSLPRYILAAAAPTAAAAASASPLAAVFGGLSAGDAAAASQAISDPAKLGKLKRDLYFRWRADELLDRHQQAVNQVAHVLYRRMQLPIQQGTDADVVLPSLKAAVFVVDDSQPGGCHPDSAAALQPKSSAVTISLVTPLTAASPPSPFTAAFWMEAHVGLQQLMRNRYSAPQGGFACRDCQGIAKAKVHCLQQRGWAVVVLQQSEVEAALGGFKAGRVKVGESYDYRGLQKVLRTRLQL